VQVVPEKEEFRVVGFFVEPISVKHRFTDDWKWDGKAAEGFTHPMDTCSQNAMLNADDVEELQLVAEGEEVLFTYVGERAVQTPVGATPHHIRIARFAIASCRAATRV